jgi:hypothetical protein
MAQNLKSFTEKEKDLDCFSSVLLTSEYADVEKPITQHQLKELLENVNKFDLISKLSEIQPGDIVVFLEKNDGLFPYKHAYTVKNSKRETVLTRPMKGQKITLSNLPLEMKKKKTAHFKTRVYRERVDEIDKPIMRSNSSTRNNSRSNVKNNLRKEKLEQRNSKLAGLATGEIDEDEDSEDNYDDEENEDDMVFVEEDDEDDEEPQRK